MKTIKLRCSKCNWETSPGTIIPPDSIKNPPYHCPACGGILEIGIFKPPNLITRLHILGDYFLFYFYKYLVYFFNLMSKVKEWKQKYLS